MPIVIGPWLSVAASAQATIPVVEVAYHAYEAPAGDSAATRVVLQPDGDGVSVTAVGYETGPEGHGTDALLMHVPWEGKPSFRRWDAGLVGAELPDSDDRLGGVALGDQGEVYVCGRLGREGGSAPSAALWVARVDVSKRPVQVDWTASLTDGPDSDDHDCAAIAVNSDAVLVAGRSSSDPWWVPRLDPTSGAEVGSAVRFGSSVAGAPVSISDIATDRGSGAFALAGAFAAPGRADTDALLRYHEPSGEVRWQGVFGDDASTDTVLDVDIGLDGEVVTVVQEVLPGKLDVNSRRLMRVSPAGDGNGGLLSLWEIPGVWGRSAYDSRGATGKDADDLVVSALGISYGDGEGTYSTGLLGAPEGRLVGRQTGSSFPRHPWPWPVVVDDVAALDGVVAMAGSHAGKDGSTVLAIWLVGLDHDRDGVADVADECPDNPYETKAGVCGCGEEVLDSDEDGTPDCIDSCPGDPLKSEDVGVCGCGVEDVDSDGDGVLDCNDACPEDSGKVAEGPCGCGLDDEDLDDDGVVDCEDACLGTPDDVGEVGADGCADAAAPRCGCAATGAGGPLLIALGLSVAILRRRDGHAEGGKPAGSAPEPEGRADGGQLGA